MTVAGFATSFTVEDSNEDSESFSKQLRYGYTCVDRLVFVTSSYLGSATYHHLNGSSSLAVL